MLYVYETSVDIVFTFFFSSSNLYTKWKFQWLQQSKWLHSFAFFRDSVETCELIEWSYSFIQFTVSSEAVHIIHSSFFIFFCVYYFFFFHVFSNKKRFYAFACSQYLNQWNANLFKNVNTMEWKMNYIPKWSCVTKWKTKNWNVNFLSLSS